MTRQDESTKKCGRPPRGVNIQVFFCEKAELWLTQKTVSKKGGLFDQAIVYVEYKLNNFLSHIFVYE